MRSPTPLTLSAFVLCVLTACSSSGSKSAAEGPEEYIPIRPQDGEPIGKFLADFDNSMRYWTNLMLAARSEDQRREARQLESYMGMAATRRFDDLLVQLETGPTRNRQRAAAALGFSKDRAAQGPLLAALDDPDPDVVLNALLGLRLLSFPDTPTETILTLLESHPDPETRSNAASALRAFVEAGQDPQPYLGRVRMALHDPSGGVRVQCTLLVGLAGDAQSVARLADMLHEPEPLVTNAAVVALVLVGKRTDKAKGDVARALVENWQSANKQLSSRLRMGMIELAGLDYGDDEEPWVEWAQRLP